MMNMRASLLVGFLYLFILLIYTNEKECIRNSQFATQITF